MYILLHPDVFDWFLNRLILIYLIPVKMLLVSFVIQVGYADQDDIVSSSFPLLSPPLSPRARCPVFFC